MKGWTEEQRGEEMTLLNQARAHSMVYFYEEIGPPWNMSQPASAVTDAAYEWALKLGLAQPRWRV
jgi:hypothetical protein